MSGTNPIVMGDRGRIVVPSDIRRRQGLTPGTPLVLIESDAGLIVMTREQALAAVRRQLADEPSLVDSLLADRRAAAEVGE